MEVCAFTFEEGTTAAWLYDLIKPSVAEVVVFDPRKNALLKAGNKNDRRIPLNPNPFESDGYSKKEF